MKNKESNLWLKPEACEEKISSNFQSEFICACVSNPQNKKDQQV